MTARIQRDRLALAYAMIAAARRVRPTRDGGHTYQKYFFFWAAFDNIYTALADREGLSPKLRFDDDGSLLTYINGSVRIPQVEYFGDLELIQSAYGGFDGQLRHSLVMHDSTNFFLHRDPYWHGQKVEFDAFGQKVNGVIDVKYTIDLQYPVWSPIDLLYYEEYLSHPQDDNKRDFIAFQVVALLYTVRKNIMLRSRKFDDSNDLSVIKHALPLLELIVKAFTG